MSDLILQAVGVNSYYGRAHVVFDADVAISAGSCTALLGRNGAGKSTLLKTLARAQGVGSTGEILLDGRSVMKVATHRLAGLGLQLVPEDRRVFRSLTVRQNIRLGSKALSASREPLPLNTILDLFPTLKPLLGRYGNELSGGEQQLVAIARAMTLNPRILLLDEPSAGLSPTVLSTVGDGLRRVREQLGTTVMLAEQNVTFATKLAGSVIVVSDGRVAYSGSQADFTADEETRNRYLGV